MKCSKAAVVTGLTTLALLAGPTTSAFALGDYNGFPDDWNTPPVAQQVDLTPRMDWSGDTATTKINSGAADIDLTVTVPAENPVTLVSAEMFVDGVSVGSGKLWYPDPAHRRETYTWQPKLTPGNHTVGAKVTASDGTTYQAEPYTLLAYLGTSTGGSAQQDASGTWNIKSSAEGFYGGSYAGVPLQLWTRVGKSGAWTLRQSGITTTSGFTFKLPPVATYTEYQVRALATQFNSAANGRVSPLMPGKPVAQPQPKPVAKPIVTGTKNVTLQAKQTSVKAGKRANYVVVGGFRSPNYTFLLQSYAGGKWSTVGAARSVGTTVPLGVTFTRKVNLTMRVVQVAGPLPTSPVVATSKVVTLRVV
jgi:hypothetical protein